MTPADAACAVNGGDRRRRLPRKPANGGILNGSFTMADTASPGPTFRIWLAASTEDLILAHDLHDVAARIDRGNAKSPRLIGYLRRHDLADTGVAQTDGCIGQGRVRRGQRVTLNGAEHIGTRAGRIRGGASRAGVARATLDRGTATEPPGCCAVMCMVAATSQPTVVTYMRRGINSLLFCSAEVVTNYSRYKMTIYDTKYLYMSSN